MTSHLHYQLTEIQELLAANRASDCETELTLDEIREEFRPDVDLESVRGSSRLISLCDLVFIRDPDAAAP